jgi:hypothetical protein
MSLGRNVIPQDLPAGAAFPGLFAPWILKVPWRFDDRNAMIAPANEANAGF